MRRAHGEVRDGYSLPLPANIFVLLHQSHLQLAGVCLHRMAHDAAWTCGAVSRRVATRHTV